MHLKVHFKCALKEMHFKLMLSSLHCKLSERAVCILVLLLKQESLFSIVPLWDKFEVRRASCENGELSARADRGVPVLWCAEHFHYLLSGLNTWADTFYLLYSCRGQCGFSHAYKVKSPWDSRITITVPGNIPFLSHNRK